MYVTDTMYDDFKLVTLLAPALGGYVCVSFPQPYLIAILIRLESHYKVLNGYLSHQHCLQDSDRLTISPMSLKGL